MSMRKNLKLFSFPVCLIILILCTHQTLFTYSQTEQDAEQAIQQGKQKLIESLTLLEDVYLSETDLRELVQRVDNARQTLWEAESDYENTQYSSAYQKANEASEQLDAIIDDITSKISIKTRNNWIIYSFIGFTFAISAIFTVIFFKKKIYPWFLKRRIEEYEKLEIQYSEKEGDI